MIRWLLSLALLLVCSIQAPAKRPRTPAGGEWWRGAVFYQIYTWSFQDGEGDGIGDLDGITARLDYLQELGVDAIWLTPCFPSPQVDFGYDVADYRDIDPRHGTLQEFDRLVAQARKRGIRVVLDLVLNHTSDQHAWFKESRSSRQASKRDWYIWRDGKGHGIPPSNWCSLFGGSAWTFDHATGQYYYHYFYQQQPDLNWRNPAVRTAIHDVIRWWSRRGVAGFRLDAVDNLLEDPHLRDNPVLPGTNAFGDPNMTNHYNYKLEENQALLRELRRVADRCGAVLIGETYTGSTRELKAYYGNASRPGLHLPTGYMLAMEKSLTAPVCRRHIAEMEGMGAWPVWTFGNHDLPRALSRYGDGVHDQAIAKALGALLLTLRGTPILYYGEELGMVNHDPQRKEDVRDGMGCSGWPHAKRRDGTRTPMQWDAGHAAGFTTGAPWLPVPPSAATCNVAVQDQDPDSVLNFYRRLGALRRSTRALRDGAYRDLCPEHPHLLAYQRSSGGQRILVALNLTPERRRLALSLGGQDLSAAKVLLATGTAGEGAGLPEALEPYGVVIAALDSQGATGNPG